MNAEQMREAFERYVRSIGWDDSDLSRASDNRFGDTYSWSETERCWKVWQAALTHPQEPARVGGAPDDLTDDQIDACAKGPLPKTRMSKGFRDFARNVIAARDAQWQAARVGGVPEGFDVQHHMAIGAGLVLPMFVVRDTFTQVSVDVVQDESPVVYALLKALTDAPQAPADVVRDAARKALEDLEDAAHEWARYVEVDSAPCSLVEYLAPHVENVLAAMSTKEQP